MIRGQAIRDLYESLGPKGFVLKTRQLLGITKDRFGRPTIENPEVHPSEFSLREVAEALCGRDWVNALQPGHGFDQMDLLEMDAAVVPSAFANTSAFNATVGGLIEAKILETFRRPGFIADRLVQTRPTRLRSEKMPGVASLGDLAEEIQPGNPHPRAQLTERYVQTPEIRKRGLAVDVTKEAVFYDLTNQVLMQAERVGEVLGLRKEKRVLDTVMGIVNTYNYGGTTYNTYVSGGNWTNTHANQLQDWTSINKAEQLLADMTEQENGERILVVPDTILVMPYHRYTAANILNATAQERRTDSQGVVTHHPNPLRDHEVQIVTSPIAMQRLTDADGLNLAANVAQEYWFYGEFRKAFAYMENWGVTVRRADVNDYIALDRDLVFSVFANEAGTPAIVEPRYVTRNTN